MLSMIPKSPANNDLADRDPRFQSSRLEFSNISIYPEGSNVYLIHVKTEVLLSVLSEWQEMQKIASLKENLSVKLATV